MPSPTSIPGTQLGLQGVIMPTCLRLSLIVACFGVTSPAFAADFITYFQTTPIVGQLDKTAWGAAAVGPRDTSNGLEDPTMSKWAYWDGKIIKGPDGKYHLFGSRWDQAGGHAGYPNSVAIHAVSDTPQIGRASCRERV